MSKSSRLTVLADNTLVTIYERKRCKSENINHDSHDIIINKNLVKLRSGIKELEQELSLAEETRSLSSQDLREKEDTLIKLTKQVEKLEALMGESNDISARELLLDLNSSIEPSGGKSKKKSVRFTDPIAELNEFDDHQVLQLQQRIMSEQDEDLDRLDEAVGRQRELGILIGEELDYHVELLTETEHAVDNTEGRLASARRRLNRVSKQAKEQGRPDHFF
ncbi:28_t:CDS:2 [Ambispora leptoticha]|uniref:28_t:CDS:1 n=1 Tax=Ambispora leptoticha TaxID=144679 RepID=A0A9N9ALR4_9GLOM|nr:28_t:CDS:2 [Ambispora leptoticha]